MGLESQIWIAKLKNWQHSSLTVKCFHCLNKGTDFAHQHRFNATATPLWQKYDLRRRQSFILSDPQARRSRNPSCMLRINEIDGANIFYTTLESINQPQGCRKQPPGLQKVTHISIGGGCCGGPKQSVHARRMSQISPGVMHSNPRKTCRACHKADGFTWWDEMRCWQCGYVNGDCNADARGLFTPSPNAFFWCSNHSII